MDITVAVTWVVTALVAFFAIINIIPPKKKVEKNPFVVGKGNLPMIAAHRGGGACNPENTMLAFREAVKTYGVEIIESDLYLTKDGYLVYNHDSYIDETCNINGDISLEEVAAQIGFSKFHFSRLFRQFTDTSFYDYLCARRIKAAEALLLDPNLPITEIALQSGFASISTFNRVFKKFKECTPTEFKEFYKDTGKTLSKKPKKQ